MEKAYVLYEKFYNSIVFSIENQKTREILVHFRRGAGRAGKEKEKEKEDI